jgi:hypothetical protein
MEMMYLGEILAFSTHHHAHWQVVERCISALNLKTGGAMILA